MLRNLQERVNKWKTSLLRTQEDLFSHWFVRMRENPPLSNQYLNRRLIFLIDIVLVATSMLVIFGALYSLDLKKYSLTEYAWIFSIQCFTYALAFYFFRTYQGVVRHSTFYDLINIFMASTLAFVLLNVIDSVYQSVYNEKLFIFQVIFVNYLAIILALVFFRIMVKYFFDRLYWGRPSAEVKRVLIAGTNSSAVNLAQGLLAEKPARFHPIGFLTGMTNTQETRILNRSIYTTELQVLKNLKEEGLEAIIVMPQRLSFGELTYFTDLCLEADLYIYKYGLIEGEEMKGGASSNVQRFKIEDLLGREPISISNEKNEQQFNDKTIMVTGAAGSIGSEIVRQLLHYQPSRVILVDQAETPLANLKLELDNEDTAPEMVYLVENVCNRREMEAIVQQYEPKIIFHAAAYKHVPMMEMQPAKAIINNVEGSMVLADLAMKYEMEKMVFISTDKAVNPANVMGASKRIAECYMQLLQNILNGRSKTQFITTRFGNVLGSNGSVIPIFTKQIEQGGPVTITHPDIIRYFMTIEEACQLVLEACTMGKGGQILIFDMGKPVKILDLAKKMIHLNGLVPGKDIDIEITGLRPGEKLYEELINDSAKVVPSHHPKIMILSDSEPPGNGKLMLKIKQLVNLCETATPEQLVAGMKDVIPEFVSENSAFGDVAAKAVGELVAEAGER